jgi:DNA-binding NarL/FixJ family response regulator
LVHIEDDPVWVDVVARILERERLARHIGSTAAGRVGLSLCREKCPEIVLLDICLPDADGLKIAEQLRALPQPPRILFFTVRTDELTLFRAWTISCGLIWKSRLAPEHLRTAFSALADGRRYFPPEVLEAIHKLRRSPDAFFKLLTNREQSLIEMFARGEPDEKIAAACRLSSHTVHSHRKHIMAKLNLHCLQELMIWGAKKGFTR